MVLTPSSINELQLSSIKLQLSDLLGLIFKLLSLQSVEDKTKPIGCAQDWEVIAKLPKPSLSASK